MEKNLNTINLPQYGMISEIARLAGVSRPTASMALRHNTQGTKAKLCRQIYYEKFANQDNHD